MAVFLSGAHSSKCFESEGNQNWGGLIIPSFRIEINLNSIVDTDRNEAPALSLTRTADQTFIRAKRGNEFEPSQIVTLQNGLPSTGEKTATFAKWQIVIDRGNDTVVLWSTHKDL